MQEVTGGGGKCTGWTAADTDKATLRKNFVKTFLRVVEEVEEANDQANDTSLYSLCPTLTAMAEQESNFSEHARSWDSLCPAAQDADGKTVPCDQGSNNDGDACTLPASLSSYIPGGVCMNNLCHPIQGGFGVLQFDLMWYKGAALKQFTRIPTTAYDQLAALLPTPNNPTLVQADGTTPFTIQSTPADNLLQSPLATLFQSCHNSSPWGAHFTQQQFENALAECTDQLSKLPGGSSITKESMCNTARTYCPFVSHTSPPPSAPQSTDPYDSCD